MAVPCAWVFAGSVRVPRLQDRCSPEDAATVEDYMRAITFLNALVESLPVLTVLSKITSLGTYPQLAEKLKDNDDLLSELAGWLDAENEPLPDDLFDMRFWLQDLREAYRATYGQES